MVLGRDPDTGNITIDGDRCTEQVLDAGATIR